MDFITSNIEIFIIALLLLTIGGLALSVSALISFRRARRMYQVFMTGTDSKNLEAELLELVSRINGLEKDRTAQGKHLRELEQKLSLAVQKVGMVRFNAFQDAGGELSFALALLDNLGTGIVVSSIYGRAEARVYAKAVNNTKSSLHLSKEEEQAIAQAMQNNKL